jgi:chromate transport protein ChrA
MNFVFDILTTSLVSAIIVGPSISFLVWLVIRLKKQKDQMRTRILSSLKIVTIALLGCILIGLISRALETSSDSNLLVFMSMISSYAYYLFIALNIVLFSLLVLALPLTKSNAYEENH